MKLAYVSPGAVPVSAGRIGLDFRTVSGLVESAGVWPGDVLLVGERGSDVANRQMPWYHPAELPFSVVLGPTAADAIRHARPTVITGLHRPGAEWLTTLGIPAVLTSEVTAGIRYGIAAAGTRSAVTSARIALGQIRLEAEMRRTAQRAAALQCNGPAALSSYGKLNPHSMLFHDHRMRAADIELAQQRSYTDGTHLHIAFSGRLVPEKGALDVLDFAERAHRRGLPVHISVFGTGPLLPAFADADLPNLTLRGFVNFETEWKRVFREEVDIALIPTPQGDPSMTYFECMGSGVPVIGYANATWRTVARTSRAGVALPKRGGSSLLAAVERVLDRPAWVQERGVRGVAYLRDQPYEVITRRRMAHIASVLESQ